MIVGFTSVSGAPGVSTLAVIAASVWPGSTRPLLVEADTSGVSLAARLPGALKAEPSLAELVTHGRHGFDEEAVLRSTQALPHGGDVVVASANRGTHLEAVRALLGRSSELAAAFEDRDVLVDLGRLGGAPLPPTRSLDGLLVAVSLEFFHVEALLRQIGSIARLASAVAVVGVRPPSGRSGGGVIPVDEAELDAELRARTDDAVGLAGVLDNAPREAGAWFSPSARRLSRLGLTRQVVELVSAAVQIGEGDHERV